MLNVFISGLEKQSGKTLVVAGIAGAMQSLSFPTCVYKPIQTGAVLLNGVKSSHDMAFIKRIDPTLAVSTTYILSGTESPFVSAYKDNLKIDINTIFSEFKILSKGMDCAIIEGGNSISSPVAQNTTELDLVKMLNVPLVLVINPKKSPIHSVISALKYISSEGVTLKGIILNQCDSESENLEEKYFSQIINEFSNIKVLGSIPDLGGISHITPETLISDTINNTDIEEIFGLKIAKLNKGI
jgi:dethiobiotin synthetase